MNYLQSCRTPTATPRKKPNFSQVTEYIPQSVARMEADQRFAQAKKDAEETERYHDEVRACALQILGDGLTRLSERLDQHEARKQARTDQLQRQAEEAEAARLEAQLAALPDPDHPPMMGDDGDFQAIKEPVDTEKHNPEHRNEAATGVLPTELEEGAPPEAGQYAPTTPPESPYRTPASIGLN
jgi:hypothetical protein